ncbi:MAG: hypothetical protein ACK5IJ_08990 [Mangrovibacterium sp.]
MTRNIKFLILCLSLFTSCSNEEDPYAKTKPNIFIDCLLNPDSTVTLKAYYAYYVALEVASNPILNGEFTIFHNDLEWGVLENQHNGLYTLEKSPEIGETYTLQAKVGQETQFAKTTVPSRPQIKYNILAIQEQADSSSILTIDYWVENSTESNYYWNYERDATKTYDAPKSSSIYANWYEEELLGDSKYSDDFNKIIDETHPLGYYKRYVRYAFEGVENQKMLITKSAISSKNVDCFMHVDEGYDKYLKTMITAKIVGENTTYYKSFNLFRGIFGSVSQWSVSYNEMNFKTNE